MPLKKFLKANTLYSKKHIRLLLERGLIKVNSMTVLDGNLSVSKFCKIECEEKVLQQKNAHYIMLNKPVGVVSATLDEKHKTVINCINEDFASDLHIAGRLDLNTSGLLILTNDGQFSRKLTSPEQKIGKKYEVHTQDKVTNEYVEYFAKGMFFDYEQVLISPSILEIINDHKSHLTIFEGRYHQIKRMFARFNNKVINLHRYQMGAIKLDPTLKPGEYRALTSQEINYF